MFSQPPPLSPSYYKCRSDSALLSIKHIEISPSLSSAANLPLLLAEMASKGNLLEMGNHPLLNMSAVDDDQFIPRHNMNLNNAILEEEHHFPTHDRSASECNTRGTAQNKIKPSQWMLQILRSINVMSYSGEDRSKKEKNKNVKAASVRALYYEDGTDPIGTCDVSLVGGERSFKTNLPAASYHKSDHPNKSNNWKFVFVDAKESTNKNAPRKLPSKKLKLPTEDGPMMSFRGGNRAFHGSHVVSETIKAAFLNRPFSPHQPLKKPHQTATYSIYHQIVGIGVTTALLLFPFVMKCS